MLKSRYFKPPIFLVIFIYTFSILNLSYAIELKNTLRVPSVFKERDKDKMTKSEIFERLPGVTIPVATLFRRDGTIDVGAMEKHIKRIVTLGTIDDKCEFNLFLNGSSGNLKNNTPQIGKQLVEITYEVLEEMGVEEPLIIAGARGRNAEMAAQFIEKAYHSKARVRIFVVPYQLYNVPDEEKDHPELGRLETDEAGRINYALYVKKVIELCKEKGMDDIWIVLYDIAGACEGKEHLPYEDVEELSIHPQVLGIKVSAEEPVVFAKYSQYQKDGQFVIENGFAKLIGAFTGGTVIDEKGEKIEIKPAKTGVLIGANDDPAGYAELSGQIKNREDEKIEAKQEILGERTHPASYGDKEGKGYPKLVEGENLRLYLLGIGQIDLEDKDKYPDWFVERVRAELLVSKILLTRLTVEVDSEIDKTSFLYSKISKFLGETREWVQKLPLLGPMTDQEEGKFNKALYDNMMSAYDKILNSPTKKGKVDTRVFIDRGHIIIRVDYGDPDKPLIFSMGKTPVRDIKHAENIIADLVSKVRSRQTDTGV